MMLSEIFFWKWPKRPRCFSWRGFIVDRCEGRIHSASISEKTRARITTQVMWRVNSLVEPLRNSHGRKAMMVVSTPKMTGLATSCAPAIEDSTPPPMRCASEWMPSPTTIASSTTMPSTSRKAKVDSMFRETSTEGSSTKAPA